MSFVDSECIRHQVLTRKNYRGGDPSKTDSAKNQQQIEQTGLDMNALF